VGVPCDVKNYFVGSCMEGMLGNTVLHGRHVGKHWFDA